MADEEYLTDYPDLDKLFEKLRSEPDSLVFAPLADACRKVGRLEEALEICTNGIAHHPDYASGHVVLGKCFYDIGDQDRALDSFQTVLSLDENNLVALKYLGTILAEQGRETAAMEHFKHILALDPENTEIRSKLENLQERQDTIGRTQAKEEEGVIHLGAVPDEDFEGKVISLSDEEETSDEFATLTLAEIYSSQGYREKAIKIYEEILRRRPDNKLAKQKLAELDPEHYQLEPPEEVEEDPGEIAMEELAEQGSGIETGEGEVETGEASSKEPVDISSPPDEKEPDAAEDTSSREEAAAEPARKEADDHYKPIEEKSSLQQFRKWIERMNQ
ncbi:MAG: tetratricopeptide repeat protein [Candidatus Latescibacteria bacterium]|nr:tetratricopeptide repeat protein [Candidatus Latescibacterota bacterium]NIM20965.1 tetratricopeptide repeat protein [Candidatus Latescibacterota bacterium]NIM65100.1 tetratricopeptide repeat protein [Candidatus Latescibacterota bacterium]NIO01615.1 tetratricopeptide repeat protein [Candidatus Latescibacterota bacterium]NIO28132.1 tetratricopeptide repeat protein [Candidatus Latescibacterota bacterium]